MERMFLLGTTALVAVMVVGAAGAADMPRKAPVAPVHAAPFNWTGCYIGVQGGGAWQSVNNSYANRGDTTFTAEADQDGSGGVVGGHLGCNLQTGHWVWGIEGDGEWASIKGDDGGIGGDINEFRTQWMASVRGRLGVAVHRTLFYATGGVAFIGAESNVLDHTTESLSSTLTGWTVGAGIEHAFTHNFTARFEYRYADFGTKDFLLPVNKYTERHDVQIHAVRFGLTYKFGGPVVARY